WSWRRLWPTQARWANPLRRVRAGRLPAHGGAVRSGRHRPREEQGVLVNPLDRFVLALRRDLLSAAPRDPDDYARRHRDDPDRFSADFKRAWASGRPEPFISMAEALDAEGDLGVKGASRLAWRLTGAGRWARLFELLHDARYGLLGAAEGHLYLAQAELGLGRPAEA